MKIYISGKISGLPHATAFTNFERAENMLRSLGYEPVNPMKLPHEHGGSWEEYLVVDLEALRTCEAVFFLDDWQDSGGARLERAEAERLGLDMFFSPDELTRADVVDFTVWHGLAAGTVAGVIFWGLLLYLLNQ